MGHYWREMDPGGAAEHDSRLQRQINLRERLKDVPLSVFMADDWPALHRLLVKGDPYVSDMERIESRIPKRPETGEVAAGVEDAK